MLLEEIEKSNSSKVVYHYCDDKGHIRSLYHIKNFQVLRGKMKWVPKCSLTNPKGPTSWVPKFPILFYVGKSCLYEKVMGS